MGILMEYSFLVLATLALTTSGRRLPRGIGQPGPHEPQVITLPNNRPQSLHLTRTFAHHVPARTVRIVKTVGVKYPVPYPVRNDVVVHVPKPYPVPVPFAQKVPVYINSGSSHGSSGSSGYDLGSLGHDSGSNAGYGGSEASYHGDASSGLAGADESSGYGSSGAGFTASAPSAGFAHGADGSSYGISPGAVVGYAGPSSHGASESGYGGAHAAALTQQSQGHAGLTQAVFLTPGNTGYGSSGDAGQGYENGINAGYSGAGYAPAYSNANHGEGTFVMVQASGGDDYSQGGGGQNAIGAIDAGYSHQGSAGNDNYNGGQENGDNSGAYATTAGDAYANYGKALAANAGYQAVAPDRSGYSNDESQQVSASSNGGSLEEKEADAEDNVGGQQTGNAASNNVKTFVTIEKAIDMGSYSYFGNNAVH